MPEPRPAGRLRLALEWPAAILVTLLSLAVLLNGTLASSWSANHVDFSINLTAAHALRHGADPYGEEALFDRAESLGSPTAFVYRSLFTSYIQPPTSALSLLPLTALPWRDASRAYLVLNHVFLAAAVGVTLVTIRPRLPLRWTVAAAAAIVAAFAQLNASFALGQVDATVLLLLSAGYWGYSRDKPAVTGVALALAAAVKLVPGVLVLYFLWKRRMDVVAWAAGAGAALLAVSLAYVGPDVYESYLTQTLPSLLHGSTHYTNVSLGAAFARAGTPDVYNGLPAVLSLSEPPVETWARALGAAVGIGVIGGLAFVIPPRKAEDEARRFREYYLVVAAALAINSVTWEFYVIWLLPAFLAAALAPWLVLPGGRLRWAVAAALAAAFIGLNYPADCGSSFDCYLFAPEGLVLYEPDWVPSVWVERQVHLYTDHLDAVLYLRLPSLLLAGGALGVSLLALRRASAPGEREAVVRARAPA